MRPSYKIRIKWRILFMCFFFPENFREFYSHHWFRSDWENLHSLSERPASLGIIGAQLMVPLNPSTP